MHVSTLNVLFAKLTELNVRIRFKTTWSTGNIRSVIYAIIYSNVQLEYNGFHEQCRNLKNNKSTVQMYYCLKLLVFCMGSCFVWYIRIYTIIYFLILFLNSVSWFLIWNTTLFNFFPVLKLFGYHLLAVMSDSNPLKLHAVSCTNRGPRCTLRRKSLEPQRTSSCLRFVDGLLICGNPNVPLLSPKGVHALHSVRGTIRPWFCSSDIRRLSSLRFGLFPGLAYRQSSKPLPVPLHHLLPKHNFITLYNAIAP